MADEGRKYSLETTRADKAVWLMKCPPAVSQSWQAATANAPSPSSPSHNPIVAKVVLSLDLLNPDDNDESSMQFTMEMSQQQQVESSRHTQKIYSLNMTKNFVPACIFSESNQGKLALEGKIEHKFDMKPHTDNFGEYGKLCRERTNKSMIKTRQVQVLDNDHGVLMRPMPGLVGLMSSGSKDKQKKMLAIKETKMKRTRCNRPEMDDIIFKLFERQPNWALKQLVQETDQPEQFLKEVLNDLCVYNKRGPNQGTHELKPEYKRATEDTN